MSRNHLLFVSLAVGLLLAGCQDSTTPTATNSNPDRPRVAYVTNGVADFWKIAQAGADAAGRQYDVDVEVLMPTGGVTDQKRMVEDLVTKQVDGIAISPIDPVNQTDLLNRVATTTRVITHDSDAPDSKRLAYVGMDNYDAGRMAGNLLKESMPDGGEVFIFIGRLEQDNARRRRQGLIDEVLGREPDPSRYDEPGSPVSGGGYTVLGTLTDQFDRAKGKANVEDVLSRHPDVDCMVGLFAYNPPLILEALDSSGRLGDVMVVAFDEDDETLQGIKDGHVEGTVVQNPYEYGRTSVEILAKLARGDDPGIPSDGMVAIPARTIRAADVDAFWADLKAKTGGGE
ncbi:MAG: sugar ABC transporter substrate-binding protein [Planctomycetaceae bacterium]|nr:sugar ABC transporter substrate-binding protein [Planctomycetaceae bacterium]